MARHFALTDQARHRPSQRRLADVVAIEQLSPTIGRLVLQAPQLGVSAYCGQFAMLSIVHRSDLMPRPLAYCRVFDDDTVGFLIKAYGPGSWALLTLQPKEQVHVLGPLGVGFPPSTANQRCWVVAGGIGIAPFGMLAAPNQQAAASVLLGIQDHSESGFVRECSDFGAQLDIASQDGSHGWAGTVVELLQHKLNDSRPDRLFTCGPYAMMAAVAKLAYQANIACWLSVEAPMACGIGICRGCAHRDATGSWRCICVDGPVYPSNEMIADLTLTAAS